MDYELIRSKRKTVSLTVLGDGRVTVRAPLAATDGEIEQIVMRHADWLERKIKLQLERQADKAEGHTQTSAPVKPTPAEKAAALELLSGRTAFYAQKTGKAPTQIKITCAQRRYGSCSTRGHICYSYKTALLPLRLYDYVVVHELCHLQEMNHSRRFYSLVEAILPDAGERRQEIKRLSRTAEG